MQKEKQKSCPISVTHNRLKDIHALWHKAALEYQNPDAFRINLNSIIQEMRNITFLLQSEGRIIPRFEKWYEQWQEIMKKDEVLDWIKNARNKIVKQGDLETYSIARVKILTWDEKTLLELKIPPSIPSKSIALYLAKQELKIPEYIYKVCVLEVDRRWSIPDFPNEEILTLLAYVFEFLNKLTEDAHKQCGIKINDCQNYQYFSKLKKELVVKNVRISLGNKKFLNIHIDNFVPTEDIMKKAKKRYKIEHIIRKNKLNGLDPFEDVNFFLKHSKNLLSKDKYHISIIFLYLPGNKNPILFNLSFRDQAEKFLGMREIAKEVEKKSATGFIYIGEIWIATADEASECIKNKIRASEAKNRKEALTLVVAISNGKIKTYVTEFKRGLFGRIKFKPTEIIDSQNLLVDNYFKSIFQVWNWKMEDNNQVEIFDQIRQSAR